ncbi:hypothetical protein Rxycam_02561 [Rubrobacter xylanophilus DSM 9941]|uniref:hypothetical protein n=1 Tax=Rubrobacter xylanophilus TaxID=49319 RepID=UPI001C63DE9D|nr:hypothetical protein [Rubrobacter xylanophilus]QYJ16726.1 hypothetical protein Rxycam_02561 [Rubrobacter xylanophilus DSM 9941]
MTSPAKPWSGLSRELGGRFAARGLPPAGFSLFRTDGREFGHLRMEGPGGARLTAAKTSATVERKPGERYAMLWEGTGVLSVEGPAGGFRVLGCGEAWEAKLRLLRNAASARGPGGWAQVEGDLAGLRYGARFEGECGLPVALFLLYRLSAARSRAFLLQTGG